MKKHTAVIAIVALFALSAVIYWIQFEMFHDPDTTEFYMLQDWAFLPVQIAIVTIVVGMIVSDREKKERMSRTRTLASAFFRDFGTDMHELDDRPGMMAEISRVLKPGGKLGIIEFKKNGSQMGPPVHERISGEEMNEEAGAAGYFLAESFDMGENLYCHVYRKAVAYFAGGCFWGVEKLMPGGSFDFLCCRSGKTYEEIAAASLTQYVNKK